MMNDRVKIYQLWAGNQRAKTLIDPKPAIFIINPSDTFFNQFFPL